MDNEDKRPGEEVKRLQRAIHDLVGLLALPALWSSGDPSHIARMLMDILQRLLHLDLIYVQLKGVCGDTPLEFARVVQTSVTASHVHAIGVELHRLLGDDPLEWPSRAWGRFNDRDLCIVRLRLGLHGEIGTLVAGAERMGFPGQIEDLVLRVAANQVVLSLQEARLLREQARVENELDQRAAQRAAELGATNEQLKLRTGLLQMIPVAAWTIRPDGRTDFINHNWIEYTGQSVEYVLSEPAAWMAVLHPDDREVAATSFWNGIRSGRDFAMETRFRRVRDGAYRWHLNRAAAVRDASGKVIKFLGTSTDIEDIKRSQQKLRRRGNIGGAAVDKGPLVTVVDDDESVRESLPDLLREFGFESQSFKSGEDFLASSCLEQTKCLILDVTMPGMSGFDLQQELKRRNLPIPVVFITAHRNENSWSNLPDEKAVACLLKPFSDTSLLRAIRAALATE